MMDTGCKEHHPTSDDIELARFGNQLEYFVIRRLPEKARVEDFQEPGNWAEAAETLNELKEKLGILVTGEPTCLRNHLWLILGEILVPSQKERNEKYPTFSKEISELARQLVGKVEALVDDVVVRSAFSQEDCDYWRPILKPFGEILSQRGVGCMVMH